MKCSKSQHRFCKFQGLTYLVNILFLSCSLCENDLFMKEFSLNFISKLH